MNWVEVLKSDLELYSITFPEDDVSYQFRLLSMREYRLFNKLMLGGLEPPFFIYEASLYFPYDALIILLPGAAMSFLNLY